MARPTKQKISSPITRLYNEQLGHKKVFGAEIFDGVKLSISTLSILNTYNFDTTFYGFQVPPF
jgi:hypothetical protein